MNPTADDYIPVTDPNVEISVNSQVYSALAGCGCELHVQGGIDQPTRRRLWPCQQHAVATPSEP